MAKEIKTDLYIQNKAVTGDMYTSSGKYELGTELTQKQLKQLYLEGYFEIVSKK